MDRTEDVSGEFYVLFLLILIILLYFVLVWLMTFNHLVYKLYTDSYDTLDCFDIKLWHWNLVFSEPPPELYNFNNHFL